MIQESIANSTVEKSEMMDVGPEEYAKLHELTTIETDKDLRKIEDYIEKVIKESFEEKKYGKLVETFNSEDYRRTLLYSGKYAEICMIVNLYENDGCFLDLADSMDELIYMFRSLKFLLYRVEFIDSDEERTIFVELIKNIGFSPRAVAMMVRWVNYNVIKIYERLEELFAANDMSDYSREMINARLSFESEQSVAGLDR